MSTLYSDIGELNALRFHVKQKKLVPLQQLLARNTGDHHALRKGRGMTFSEVRQYQPGDDVRHIDWRVTARTQKVHTKVFTEEHERPTVLVTEQSAALFFGSKVRLKSAQALNIAALIGWTALQQHERIGGLCFRGDRHHWIAPNRPQHSLLQFLEAAVDLQKGLKRPGACPNVFWHQSLKQLTQTVKPGSQLFLIGDLLDFDSQAFEWIKKLRSHNEITAIHVFDPLEKQLPKSGWLSLARSFISDDLLRLDSFRDQTREEYSQGYQARWQNCKQGFRALAIPLIEVGTDESPLKSLMQQNVIH
ncbi:DUF58 domain-containing protein [Thiomicrorhabdus sp.]|uniref:DUF58 domain-containing protein n=1 Tax=Thiomicrorhabdus sp. TaxID=2039724 RepID=UPI0029C7BEBA|nr:DUF58 domain-containing protein [Thiomicrorhabdus sp.]